MMASRHFSVQQFFAAVYQKERSDDIHVSRFAGVPDVPVVSLQQFSRLSSSLKFFLRVIIVRIDRSAGLLLCAAYVLFTVGVLARG